MYLKHFENEGLTSQIDSKILNGYLTDYYWYHKEVLANKTNIHIITFDRLINETKETIEEILSVLGHDSLDYNLFEKAKSTYGGAKSKLGSSKPSVYKEQLKAEFKKYIKDHPLLKKSTNLYEILINP